MAVRKSPCKTGWTVRRQVQKTLPNKAEALQYHALVDAALTDAWRRYQQRITPCCSIRAKLDEFLSDSHAGLGRRRVGYVTLERHRRRLVMFNSAFQGKSLDAIDRERVERWIKRRLAGGVSADTVNADLNSLKAFARWAHRKGYAPTRPPLLDVERLHVPGKLPGRNVKPPRSRGIREVVGIITRVTRDRPDIGLVLAGMALFGLRPANICGLRRQDAIPTRAGGEGRLFVRGLKGTPDRDIPIPSGGLRDAWIRKCLTLGKQRDAERPSAPLVPNLAGRSTRNPGGWTTGSLDMALARVLRGARVRFTPYQVRHSCINWLARQDGIVPDDLKDYAGHLNNATQEIYKHGHRAEPVYQVMEMALQEWFSQEVAPG